MSPYAYTFDNPVLYIDPDGRSGELSINEKTKTITVTSHYYVYGSGANQDVANTFASSVETMWNYANGTVKINKVDYKVVFKVTAQAVTLDKAIGIAEGNVGADTDYSTNFLRVEAGYTGLAQNFATGSCGSNSVIMSPEHVMQNITTSAHEYGHGLGLIHVPDGAKIEGIPTIMATIHNIVEAYYTVDPGGGRPSQMVYDDDGICEIINPMDERSRRVLKSDVENLHIERKEFSPLNKGKIGSVNNVILDESGDALDIKKYKEDKIKAIQQQKQGNKP